MNKPTVTAPAAIDAAVDQPNQHAAIGLFRMAKFRALFLGNLSNAFGIELRLMAQSWLILELGGSQFWVGAANGLRAIPVVVLSLFAGVWVDRFGGRNVLLVERLLLLGLAAVTALIVITDAAEVWHVVVLSVAAGALIAMGLPAMQTMVRFVVEDKSIQIANSLNQLTFSAARALAPLGGGFLIAAFGLGSPWLALAGLYVLAVMWTLRLPGHQADGEPKGISAVAQIKEGITYIRNHPVLSRVMLLSFTGVFTGSLIPIIPIYARERFDVGETGFGVMMAAFAVGQGLAAAYIVLRGGWKRQSNVILFVTFLWDIPMIVFAFSNIYWLSLVMLGLVGMALPLWVTSVATILQTQSDRKMLGRVMSIYALSINAFFFGAFTGAWMGELIGNELMLTINALLSLVIHAGLILTSPRLRAV